MSAPPITVAIPVYRGAAYLEETIESVLRQTHEDFELLVCDDDSDDVSLEIARAFHDPRLVVESHPRLGIAGNWNRCLQLARGRFVKVLPQDDLLRPDCLATSLAMVSAAANPVLMFSRREVIFDPADAACADWARRYRELDGPLQPLGPVNSGVALLERWARRKLWGNLIGEPVATVFPTELARTLGGFPTAMVQDLDYAFWIRLLARGEVVFTSEALCSFRMHAAGATAANSESGKLGDERLLLLRELGRDPEVRRHVPHLARWAWTERAARVGRRIRRFAGL